MQITRATDYAVRVVIHLATLPAGSRLPVSELARGSEAPESFVSKVLQQLVQRGLVRSQRGAGGGFQLAVRPESISLLDIVEIMEGPLRINLCLPGKSMCTRRSWCGAHPVWNQAQKALRKALAKASIKKLATDSKHRLRRSKHSSNRDILVKPVLTLCG